MVVESTYRDGFNFMGIGATWGEDGTNIDESQTYNIYQPESASAKLVEYVKANPKTVYIFLGVIGLIAFVFVARNKEK